MKVSICICTCNRPAMLQRLLGSLRSMELGSFGRDDVQTLVVDNNPNGEAVSVCERASSHLPVALRLVKGKYRGTASRRRMKGSALPIAAAKPSLYTRACQ